MEREQVSFGRRGQRRAPDLPPRARPEPLSPHAPPFADAADFIVSRSIARMMMYFSILVAVVFLTAGSKKHSSDLPFWMRPDADFTLRDYGPTVLILAATFALLIGPMLRRPIALKFYSDHLEYIPLLGRPKLVPWSDISEITKSNWERGRWVNVLRYAGPRLSFQTNALELSADDLIERMHIAISQSGRRNLRLSGEPISGSYLLPGH